MYFTKFTMPETGIVFTCTSSGERKILIIFSFSPGGNGFSSLFSMSIIRTTLPSAGEISVSSVILSGSLRTGSRKKYRTNAINKTDNTSSAIFSQSIGTRNAPRSISTVTMRKKRIVPFPYGVNRITYLSCYKFPNTRPRLRPGRNGTCPYRAFCVYLCPTDGTYPAIFRRRGLYSRQHPFQIPI